MGGRHTDFPSITVNVALDVKHKVSQKKPKLREKAFTYAEAMKILRGTLDPVSERFSEAGAGARRWVPWLCAYSGARVGEIGQMHSCRITEESVPDGRKYWCMLITPLDGSVKDGEERTIPLHSHVIEQGFLEYVRKRQKAGKPLFYEPARGRGSTMHRQADKVGERLGLWVRNELEITGVQPNHGWRHRFETVSRTMNVRVDLSDHITGHEGANIAAKYGDYVVEALSNVIEMMPRYPVEMPNEVGSGAVDAD